MALGAGVINKRSYKPTQTTYFLFFVRTRCVAVISLRLVERHGVQSQLLPEKVSDERGQMNGPLQFLPLLQTRDHEVVLLGCGLHVVDPQSQGRDLGVGLHQGQARF
jgi:hypothetical protein